MSNSPSRFDPEPFNIVPLEYDIFVGMDVDKRSVAVTVYDHEKKIVSFNTSKEKIRVTSTTDRNWTLLHHNHPLRADAAVVELIIWGPVPNSPGSHPKY